MRLPDPSEPLGDPEAVFARILSGRVEDSEIAQFLSGLAHRGETVAEIVGAACALRAQMIAVDAPADAIDVCGTGGDGQHTRNISTAVAIVSAAAGATVAKHGNRAASSRSGAADVLSCLDLDLDLPPARVEASIREIGIGFLFAARHHPVMARVAPVRRALKRRTIFNVLGPLSNPAGVKRQLVGVFAPDWVPPLAAALRDLGTQRAMVVHGLDGLDELTVTADTIACEVGGPHEGEYRIAPEKAGLKRHELAAIQGGTPEENAAALVRLLDGEAGGYRDIVVLNTAAALMIAGRAADLREGAALAEKTIDSGDASRKLTEWRKFR